MKAWGRLRFGCCALLWHVCWQCSQTETNDTIVEKSEVEARYREAVVRLADIAKQDESYTGYFEREEDLK